MGWLNARVTGITAIACALSACAAIDGLDQYSDCAPDCDAGVLVDANVAEAGEPDAGRPDASPGEGPDARADGGKPATDSGIDGGDASDAASSDASDARSSDASDGGAEASDAGDGGPPLCPTLAGIDGGPVVYYPFEGDAADRSGNGNNGVTTVGTDVAYGAGKLGEGITILPGGRGVAVTGTTSLAGGKTLCAWVNPAPTTTGLGLPVFVGGMNYYDVEAASSPSAGSCTVTANTLFLDNGACSSTSLALTPGSWSFVCFAYDVGSTTFFANGSSQVVSGNQYDPYALSTITIGSNRIGGSTTASLFAGQIDEVSIWSAPLSKAAMSTLYGGGAGCRIR
jgi:hypothetical protein